jgi:aminoglycoside phosphotransferase (APT) family kinase protein
MVGEPEITPVRAAHRFDERALASFSTRLGGSRRCASRSSRAASPTRPSCRARRRALVLRKKPPGRLLPSAHQVDREYRVMSALRKSGVPVPETIALCEDDAVLGTAFFVMRHVPGA